MSGIITILKKELKRFFTDKRMLISLMIPGILIYLVYSFMGSMLASSNEVDENYIYQVNVVEVPEEYNSLLKTDNFDIEFCDYSLEDSKVKLENKEIDLIISFDEYSQDKSVSVFYNSTSNESATIYQYYYSIFMADSTNIEYDYYVNLNPNMTYDLATKEDTSAMIMQMLIPFLLIMLLFSGCMAVATESIAGEKERGTIATLLVTPVKRMDIAIGKVLALSITALFSSIISFVGTIASYPKLMGDGNVSIAMYGFFDYLQIFLIIIITVLIFTILLTIISCYAKSVKEASGLAMPIMILVMVVGVSSMMGGAGDANIALYFIPVYNSVLSLSNIFGLTFNLGGFIITIVSNLVYFGLATYLLIKMFNSERIMFNS